MASNVSTPALRCPTCGADTVHAAEVCLACGQPLVARSGGARSLAPVRIVEADAPAPRERAQSPAVELAVRPPAEAMQSERPGARALLPRLAALAWRQPAVRSVVKTGASAVALSLVWRVTGAALTSGRARRALAPTTESLAPMVGDLLRGATPSKRLRQRGRRGEVVEEIVYIRRVFRR